MKNLILLTLFLGTSVAAFGEVSIRVCEADGNTPFDGREIMVGTWLTIIINSDVGEYWPGDLMLKETNKDYGFLWGARAFDAAGTEPYIYCWEDNQFQAISFNTDMDANAGDWFIADYQATGVGNCNVGLYEWFSTEPTYEISFSHVRTRDFNNDTKVNFMDLSVFASYWQVYTCNNPNWCEGSDLDVDGDVDFEDLTLFLNYWLEVTKCNVCTRDFNKDDEINLIDFAILTSYWLAEDCSCPGWCQGTDIDNDRNVNFIDFALFSNYWLDKIQ